MLTLDPQDPIQALTKCCNILVLEMTYRTPSGKLFRLDRAHRKPIEIQDRDPLTRQLSCSSVGAVEGQLRHISARSVADCAFR